MPRIHNSNSPLGSSGLHQATVEISQPASIIDRYGCNVEEVQSSELNANHHTKMIVFLLPLLIPAVAAITAWEPVTVYMGESILGFVWAEEY